MRPRLPRLLPLEGDRSRGRRSADGPAGAARHLTYAGGWKRLEPLWDLVIRARRVNTMLLVLEATLDAFGGIGRSNRVAPQAIGAGPRRGPTSASLPEPPATSSRQRLVVAPLRGLRYRLRDACGPAARWCALVAGGIGPTGTTITDTLDDPRRSGILVGESVEMRADYLRPRLDLLRAQFEPGERLLVQGRAFEPYRDSFELSQLISGPGCAVVVTDRRVLWVSRDDQRWVRILPFAVVRSYVELTQAHRYALVLEHEGLERWQWVPAHRFLGWSWGDAEDLRPVGRSVLGFSRRDTAAAGAVRTRLQAAGVPAGAPRSLPKRQQGREVPYRVLRAQRHFGRQA